MGLRLPLVAAAVALVAGCAHNIGDSCTTNVDCDPLGTRFCDVSAPGGYCTVEGCDATPVLNSDGTTTFQDTCPPEAVCIRFFHQIADESCDPAKVPNGCRPDERCLCDQSDPATGACIAPAGTDGGVAPAFAHCAPESSELRDCMYSCTSNSDCRSPGYECRTTGSLGAEPVPRGETVTTGRTGDGGVILGGLPVGIPASFCVKSAPSFTPPPDGPPPQPTDGGPGG